MWLACWTQAQKGPGSNRSRAAVGNCLRQTVHTHRASAHQAAKLVAALLRVVRVTASVVESNSSLPTGLWLTSPAGSLPTLEPYARLSSMGYLYLFTHHHRGLWLGLLPLCRDRSERRRQKSVFGCVNTIQYQINIYLDRCISDCSVMCTRLRVTRLRPSRLASLTLWHCWRSCWRRRTLCQCS